MIFIKLHPNVPLSEMVCRTYDSAAQTQGQGHRFTLEFCDRSVSPEHFWQFSLNFTQMFLSVCWCAEPMT